jgi:hypothetical protein
VVVCGRLRIVNGFQRLFAVAVAPVASVASVVVVLFALVASVASVVLLLTALRRRLRHPGVCVVERQGRSASLVVGDVR